MFVTTVALLADIQPAAADPANPSYCDSDVAKIDNQNFGTDIPVILVHGLSGNKDDWGDPENPGFYKTINDMQDVSVVQSFSYNTLLWVNNSNNGPKLAKTIDCVSRISTANGGVGKVIVIGYSMGGLVARDALSRQSTDGQRAIADEVGQVITIGTPHRGVDPSKYPKVLLYPALIAGSGELENLPSFPSQTVVHTIAGDVAEVYHNSNDPEDVGSVNRPYDDTLVSTLSAHAEYTVGEAEGGGDTTVLCNKDYWPTLPALGMYQSDTASCEHGQLILDASNGVREDAVEAIEKYVASVNVTSLTIESLTMRFDSRWDNPRYVSGGNPPYYAGAGENVGSTNLARVAIFPYADWCNPPNTIEECLENASVSQRIDDAPGVTVGGRTPDYTARFRGLYYTNEYILAWCFTDEKICITYTKRNEPEFMPSQALLDLFATATWSS